MSIVAAELIAKVTADTSSAERDLRSFSQRMGSMTGGVFSGDLLSSGVKAVGRGLVDVGRIGVGAFTDMASSGADFEAQMDGVAAVLGGTQEQASALGQLAIDLAINPNLKVNANEAASAIENLATAGLTAEEILGGATEATVLLANSTGGDFGQAATVATDVMSLFNIKAGDMMDAVDGIAAVSNVSKFDLNDYALAISQAGGVASLSGVSFDDFNTVIAATSPAFASGSDAGTSFKTFLQRLNPTTKEATDLMGELGLLTADGTSVFYDSTGALKDMDAVVGIMNQTFGDMTEQQKSFYLGQLFGTDAMRTAGQMASMTTEDYQALQATMADTSALDSAKVRTDNFKSAWENLGGAIEAVKLQMWHGLEGAAQQIAVAVQPLIEWVAPMAVDYAKQLGDWITAEVPIVQASVTVAWDVTGSKLAAGMAGLGTLLGADVTVDADAKVVSIDWGGVSTVFDAVGNVSLNWETTGLSTTFDAVGNVDLRWDRALADFGAQFGPDHPFDIWVQPKWDAVWDYLMHPMQGTSFNAKAPIPAAITNFAAKVTEVDWGQMGQQTFEVTAKVADVVWGFFTYVYDVVGQIGLILWGTHTNTYDVNAAVKEVLWGVWEHTYDVLANVSDWINGVGTVTLPGRVVVTETTGYEGEHTGERAPPLNSHREPGNATGNPMFSGGWTMVGERGPELVRLPRASRIYNDQETLGMMGGAMVINNYNTLRQPHDIELLAQRVAAHMARKGR